MKYYRLHTKNYIYEFGLNVISSGVECENYSFEPMKPHSFHRSKVMGQKEMSPCRSPSGVREMTLKVQEMVRKRLLSES